MEEIKNQLNNIEKLLINLDKKVDEITSLFIILILN